MRKSAIATFTAKTKPYITSGTQDIHISVWKCIRRNIVSMSWTYKLEGDPSYISQQHLNQPVQYIQEKTVGSKKTYTSKIRTTFLKRYAKVKGKYEWNQETA